MQLILHPTLQFFLLSPSFSLFFFFLSLYLCPKFIGVHAGREGGGEEGEGEGLEPPSHAPPSLPRNPPLGVDAGQWWW